jgi:hypothetical protein
MASYAVGAALQSKSFPLYKEKHLKKYPPDVACAFNSGFRSDPFTELAFQVTESQDFLQLKNARDVLSHRGALLRPHFVGAGGVYAALANNPKALAQDFDYSTLLNNDVTRTHAEWALVALNRLLAGLSAFIDRHE